MTAVDWGEHSAPRPPQTTERGTASVVSSKRGALWDYTLSFYDSNMEARYTIESVQSCLNQEVAMHGIGTLGGFAMSYIQWHKMSTQGRAIMAVTIICMPMCSFLMGFWKAAYRRFRSAIIVLATVLLVLLSHQLLDNPVGPAWYHILGYICSKSPAILVFVMATNFSLRFRHQLILQITTLPGLFTWASMFCESCESANIDHGEGFGTLEYMLKSVLVFVTRVAPPNGQSSCHGVTLAIVMITAFLVPLLFVYLLGAYRCAVYAKNRLPLHFAATINRNVSDSWSIAILYFIAAVEATVALSFKMQ